MARLPMLKPQLPTLKPRLAAMPRDQRRDALEPLRPLYKTSRWQKLREQILIRDMFTCQMSGVMLRRGRSDKATDGLRPAVVDHIVPHRGDEAAFWDPDNLWAISSDMHDGPCQQIEACTGLSGPEIRAAKLAYAHRGLDGHTIARPRRWVDQRYGTGGRVDENAVHRARPASPCI